MSDAPARPWLRYFRLVVLLLGVGVMVLLVRRVGAAAVVGALVAAGPYVPLLVALEATWLGMDVLVLRALLGRRAGEVPWSTWAHSAVTVYPVTILFPAGRASAEATRAALLAPHLGAAATGLAAIQIQGVSLLSTALISAVGLGVIVATLGLGHRLAAAVGVSALITGTIGALLLFGSRTRRTRALLRRVTRRADLELAVADPSARPLFAVAWSFAARGVQAALFTFALLATTGALSARRGLIAQSIAIAGATFGDLVPQQAGVIEGAFAYFADTIGLAGQADKAVATALLIRACQISLTATTLLVGLLWRRPAPPPPP
jgi:hypothetical protein